jgi:hypothetical protein
MAHKLDDIDVLDWRRKEFRHFIVHRRDIVFSLYLLR